MNRAIIINGVVTCIGLVLDLYGVLNLQWEVALAGLMIGLADTALFLWLLHKRKVYVVKE